MTVSIKGDIAMQQKHIANMATNSTKKIPIFIRTEIVGFARFAKISRDERG